MTASPDVLHPLKAYGVIFEASLGIPHDERVQRLLRAQRIPSQRWLLTEASSLPVEQIISDPARTQQLIEEYDEAFLDIFSQKRPRRSVDPIRLLKTLSYAYGLEDGQVHPMEELAQAWGRSRNQVNAYRVDGLNEVLQYLERRHHVRIGIVDSQKLVLANALRASLII